MSLSYIPSVKKSENCRQTARFEAFIMKNGLISENERVLLALSGGEDSVFLLYLLLSIKDKYKLHIEAFHLDHCLRKESSSDADFAKALCDSLGVNIYMYRRDIAAIAKKEGISEEQAGRNERYAIISSLEERFDKIATAHHSDDNAETVIMHLIRGSGIDGLCGIPSKRGKIIRPLLCFEKSEISDFIKSNGIPFVQDESNFKNDYFRNRVRNEILPLIKKENAAFAKNVAALCQTARDYSSLALLEAEKLKYSQNENSVETNYNVFFNAPRAVRYAFIKKTAVCFGIHADISGASMEDVSALADDKNKTVWDYNIHSLVISRRYDRFIICEQSAFEGLYQNDYEYALKEEGIFVFAKQGFGLRLSVTKYFEKNLRDRHITLIDYDKIKNSIALRNRRTQDSFCPIGMQGTKTIKRFFIDRKVDKDKRSSIPILTDGENVMCILGYETDRRYMLTEDTKTVLRVDYLV